MLYHYLADLVVAVHVAYVSFVVFGQLAILIGILLRWPWIRNPWFRWIHLVMMTIVGLEAVFNITCPLTSWESSLRRLAGQEVQGDSFVGRLLHDLIFVDSPAPVLSAIHIAFALIVIGTFVIAPPRGFARRPAADSSVSQPPGAVS